MIDSTQYSLIPTKEEIIRRKEEGEGADSDGEGSAAGARKKSVKGFLKGEELEKSLELHEVIHLHQCHRIF